MKKTLTLLGFVPVMASAQLLVHTTPENRTALLEEFTGIHCGYCPEGHAIAASLESVIKDRFVTISVHAGGYADPGAGEPDFRTEDGAAIDAAMAVSGYPAGTVNRRTLSGALSYGRGDWEGMVYEALDLPSPVNVGVESAFNETTRELTVRAMGYYTAQSAAGNDHLSVLLKENHITGWQTDYGNGDQPEYDHMAVLRDHITETWGEDIGSPAVGETVERTYTYTVPEEWVIGNCQVVAFIGENQEEVYQAREVAAMGGTTLVIGGLTGDPQPYRPGTDGAVTGYVNGFTNAMGSMQDFIISLVDVNAPYGWAKSFTVNGVEDGDGYIMSVAGGSQLDIAVNITPNANAGISHYELRIASASTPNAPVLMQPFHVISGVHDLIVTNPGAEAHGALYWDGMWSESAKSFTTRADYLEFAGANALADVQNLYMNISWTFPSYTEEVANVLASFMDNGGNVFIAGQDIGWDQSGQTGAYGTAATQAFYNDYLLATFVDDGSPADNEANFEAGDAVFGGVTNTTIENVFGGANMYPDRFEPIAPAVPILRYADPTKIGGLRAETPTHKVVYFGIGPEQVGDPAVARAMVQLSHDWFYGVVGTEEFDAAMAHLGQPYPSPATDVLNINVAGVENASLLEVIDASGRLVLSQGIGNKTTLATLDVSGLTNGLYSVRARGTTGIGQARMFEVLR